VCFTICSSGRPKNPLCQTICPVFVCVHTHVHMSSWHMKSSLGHSRHHLPSGMYTRSWTDVCKEGHDSLVDQVLIVVWHIQTYVNKKVWCHMNFCTHTRSEARSPEKPTFLDSSHDQWVEGFTNAESHNRVGRVCNMKVCSCLQIEVVRRHSVVQILSFSLSFMSIFPSFLPYTTFCVWRNEKQVKFLKIDFQKKVEREHSFQVFDTFLSFHNSDVVSSHLGWVSHSVRLLTGSAKTTGGESCRILWSFCLKNFSWYHVHKTSFWWENWHGDLTQHEWGVDASYEVKDHTGTHCASE
jgi:hypothetical protein